MKNTDRRNAQRIDAELPTNITTSTGRVLKVHTWDFSDKGVYVSMTEDEASYITMGSKVTIQLTGTHYDTPVLEATVIRKTKQGIALKLEPADEYLSDTEGRDSGLL